MSFTIKLTRLLVFVPVALISFFSPAVSAEENLLSNPSFAADGSSWIGADATPCLGGMPSLGVWAENSIAFSYIRHTVFQSVVVANPSNLLFEVDVVGRPEPWILGQYEVSVVSGSGAVSTGWLTAGQEQNKVSLNISTVLQNEIVTVFISGDDGPTVHWAGCYGPIFSNALLKVDSQQSPSSSTWLEVVDTTSAPVTSIPETVPPRTVPAETTQPPILDTTSTSTQQPQQPSTTSIAWPTTSSTIFPQEENTTTTIYVDESVSASEALAIISNAGYLLSLSQDELSNIFSAIDVDGLSDEETQQVLLALQSAPDEVKEVFENEINIFTGQFDSYVPVGSSISVAERRIVIAVGAVLSVSASIATSTTQNQSGRKRAT